jgi:ribosomal protein S12 methylthiotransferase accessory factor
MSGWTAGAVAVETLFDLADRLGQFPDEMLPRSGPRHFLVLDLQRVILLHDSGRANEPGLASLLHFLLDGYPLQPFAQFAAAERTRSYRFAFDLAVLDLVPRCLTELAPGECCVFDLVTGELRHVALLTHPEAVRHVAAAPESALDDASHAVSPLKPVRADRSMRSTPPPDTGDLIDAATGIIRRDVAESDSTSLAFSRTLVSTIRGVKKDCCHSRALLPAEARSIARCEAVERFQIAFQAPGAELIRARYADVAEHAIDPRVLFFGRSSECPNDEGIVYDPMAPICWTWAWGPASRIWRLVPAQDLWFNTPPLMSEPRFVMSTTSGCAGGSTFEEAAVFALLEAVERDAFLTSWYLRRPASEIDLDSLRNEQAQQLLERFRLTFPAYEPVLLDLTSDVGIPAVGGLAIRREGTGPRVFAAAAADIDAERACFRALKDLGGLGPYARTTQDELRTRVLGPDAVATPDAHAELYFLDENFSAFDYLELGRRPKVTVQDVNRKSPLPLGSELRIDSLLETMDNLLRTVGSALFIKDISHPALAARGLYAARAITPGLFPLWFGGRRRRFEITDRLRRLAELYTGRSFDRDNLMLVAHPMS